MSNSYGIPDDIMRKLAEQYLEEQDPIYTGEEQNFAGAIPLYGPNGKPQTVSNMLNQLQDVTDLIADPMFQAGGGVGGYSEEAFQPIVTWEQVDSPEYHRWQNYMNTPDSFEGMIAAEISGGGTPMSALRKIQARVSENPESPVAQQLLMFFPATEDGIATGEIDWATASQAATEIDDLRSKIPDIGPGTPVVAPDGSIVPGAGEIMEVDGRLLRRIETPSPMMEKFQEQGLPSPFAEYTTESFLPEWTDEPFLQSEAGWNAARDAMMAADAALRDQPEPQGEEWRGTPADEVGRGEGGGGGGGRDWEVPDINIPWLEGNPLEQQHVPMPGALGAAGQMTDAVRAAILGTPWAIDVTANQMVPGLPLNTDAAAAVIEAGERNPAINTAAAVANNPAGAAINLGRDLLGSWFGGGDEEEEPSGGGGTHPQVRGKMSGKGRLKRGEEPEPPPEDLGWAGGPTELFGGGRETPAPPGAEPLNLMAGSPGGDRDWITAPPPGGLSPDAWRDYLLATLLPQYAVGNRAGQLEDEAIRAGQAAVRPRPTAPPGSEGAPWTSPPNAPPGSENAPWYSSPTAAPLSEAAPWGSRAEHLLPGITEDRQLAAGKFAAARAQEARGLPLPDYLLPYSREAMLQAIMPNYNTTAGAVEAEDQAVRRGQRVRQESIEGQERPPGVGERAWSDYLLASLLPNYPVSAAAREGEQESVSEGARIRRRESLLPGITQDEAIGEGKRAAARYVEEHGGDMPDYLYPYSSEFELASILPGSPATTRAQELESEAVHAGTRRGSIANLQQNEAMLRMILPEMATGEHARRTDEDREALARERSRPTSGERYEPTTSAGRSTFTGRQQRQQVSGLRHRQFRQAFLNMMNQKRQTYNYEHGYAMGRAQALRNAGITPLQQVYAQRMSNIINTGVPLGAQPNVAQY